MCWPRPSRTRRGARRRYVETLETLASGSARAEWVAPGGALVVMRVEKGRSVAERRVPADGGPDALGVREPRRPRPPAGGAAVDVDPDAG